MKRFITFVVFVCCAALIMTVFYSVSAASSGISFSSSDRLQTEGIIDTPLTFEAKIRVSASAASGRLGTIVGNYSGSGSSVGIEIRENGRPALWWSSSANSGTDRRLTFTGYDLRNGEITDLAITADIANDKAMLYINGELVQTLDVDLYEVTQSHVMCLGGDLRSGNTQYLKSSELFSVALFSDIRTPEEIASDASSVPLTDSSIICAYDLTADVSSRYKDLSSNGNNLEGTGDLEYEPQNVPVSEPDGLKFNEDVFVTKTAYSSVPKTFEASIYFKKTAKDRGGVILGNYNGADCAVNFEIYSNGNPRLYYVKENGEVYNIVFSVNLYNGELSNVAIVADDDAKLFRCYVNGVQKTTKAYPAGFSPDIPSNNMVLGGDLRSGNSQYFKGKLASCAFYSDARTAEEIAADANGPDLDDPNLIAAYNYSGLSGDTVSDLTGKYDVKIYNPWLDPSEKEPVTDYAYSFAVIGDIQVVTEYYPEKLPMIYDWLLENKDSKKIAYVMGMGDNTNSNTDKEWKLVKEQWFRLNGNIPYMVNRGNHDSSAQFNKYFNDKKYTDTYIGSFAAGKSDSTYRFFEISGQKYLLFTLDYGAPDSVFDWAGKIITDNPDCQVIITTHAYLYRDGTTLDQGDVCPPATNGGTNNGDAMWSKFISKYENIFLVICGHDPCDNVIVTKTKGEHGNTVTQMLVDPQGMDTAGATGMVCMLYFSEDGRNVSVEYYSTVKDKFFSEKNQFTMAVGEKDSTANTHSPTPGETSGTTPAPDTTPDNSDTSDKPEGKQHDKKYLSWLIPLIAVCCIAAAAVIFIVKKKK